MITREKVDQLEKIVGQTEGMHQEVSALARKSPNGSLNKFKLQIVNGLLADCNNLLADSHKAVKGFDKFNSDDIPSNSDVTFILTQYIQALEKFRADNIVFDWNDHQWHYDLPKKAGTLRAAAPQKLKKG